MSIDKLRSELVDWAGSFRDQDWASALDALHESIAEQACHALSALDRIHAILDGQEWDSSTASEVASVLTDLGYEIRDPEGEET